MHKYWLIWHLKKFSILDMAIKLIERPKIWHFSDKQCLFTQNFAKQPNIFLFPKFLKLFFSPKNTLPKVKNSKMGLNCIFFGTPCSFCVFDLGRGNFKKKIILFWAIGHCLFNKCRGRFLWDGILGWSTTEVKWVFHGRICL